MKKILFLLLLSINAFAQIEPSEYPPALMDTVKDIYFGTNVSDPYRWLENDTLRETKEWMDQELELSGQYLNKLKNKYNPEKQLQLNGYTSYGTITKSGRYYFDFLRDGPDENHVCLYIKKKILQEGTKIIDPQDYKTAKKDRVKITGFQVSGDNNYIAFSVSHNGSDWNEIHVMSLYPFRKQDDLLTGVKFSRIEWYQDGFFYKRYAMEGNILKNITENPSIWYHKLGTPQSEDSLIYNDPEHPQAMIDFDAISSGNYLVIYNNYVAENKSEKLVLTIDLKAAPPFKQDTLIRSLQNASFRVIGIYNGKFLAFTNFNTPQGRLVLFEKNKMNSAKSFIPAYKEILKKISIIGNKIVCIYLRDIDYICITFDSTGTPINEIDFPHGSSAEGFENSTDSMTIFYFRSFINPPIVYQYNVNSFETSLEEQTKVKYDFKDFETEKVYYYSKDSEKIPMVIAYKKG